MKNNLQNNKALEKKIDWQTIKKELREKLGNDIFDSWIKKIELVEEFHNYILLLFLSSKRLQICSILTSSVP